MLSHRYTFINSDFPDDAHEWCLNNLDHDQWHMVVGPRAQGFPAFLQTTRSYVFIFYQESDWVLFTLTHNSTRVNR